jgi:hypothetical protein
MLRVREALTVLAGLIDELFKYICDPQARAERHVFLAAVQRVQASKATEFHTPIRMYAP